MQKKVASSEVGDELIIDDQLLTHLSKMTSGFVGAEIEQAVIAALYEAFFKKRNLKLEDLELSIKGTVPLAVTQKEQILSLRNWANVRAVSATLREDLETYKTDVTEEDDVNAQRGGRMLDF